jgi:hypothetical protein
MGLDWEKGSYRLASQVTIFDPFRFYFKFGDLGGHAIGSILQIQPL